jgi:hypothetical protein
VIVTIAALVGCGKDTTPPRADAAWMAQMIEGIARTGSEEHSFQPCGQAEKWWWNWDRLEKRTLEGVDKWTAAAHGTCGDASVCGGRAAYLKAVGLVSPPGIYGHSGQYVREVDIITIESASAEPPPSCVFP